MIKKIATILFIAFITLCQGQETNIVIREWTPYSQSIDVSAEEDSEFRMSAYLKKGDNNQPGKSALWVRVENKDKSNGFFQNDYYNDSIVVSNVWEKFEILGTIGKDAQSLYFGAFCYGNGNFYFDNFKLELKSKNGIWRTANISNHDFEENQSSDNWNSGIRLDRITKTKNFDIEYVNEKPYRGKQCLKITGSNIIGNNDNGKFVEVNNVKLYYEIYGKGEPLLMLHGNGQSISAFMQQVDEFSKYYKVILVDSRGRGNSTFDWDVEFTFKLQASDMKLFLDKIGVEKTHIVGWSDGGIIGLVMAINYADKVNKLVAMGANINPEGIIDIDEFPIRVAEFKKNNLNHKYDMYIALYTLMMNYPNLVYEDLKAIKSETLIMAGDKDEIKNIHTIKMYEVIKNAQLAILPGETHYFPSENPKFFNKLVLKFLKD